MVVRYTQMLPPRNTWNILMSAVVFGVIALFVPWLLMGRRTKGRLLVPGAVIFAVLMMFGQPISHVYLARALATSAARYGAIGVAFTYIAWLYAMSFVLLGSAVVGRAVALDEGWLGRRIRGRDDAGTGAGASAGSSPGRAA